MLPYEFMGTAKGEPVGQLLGGKYRLETGRGMWGSGSGWKGRDPL